MVWVWYNFFFLLSLIHFRYTKNLGCLRMRSTYFIFVEESILTGIMVSLIPHGCRFLVLTKNLLTSIGKWAHKLHFILDRRIYVPIHLKIPQYLGVDTKGSSYSTHILLNPMRHLLKMKNLWGPTQRQKNGQYLKSWSRALERRKKKCIF